MLGRLGGVDRQLQPRRHALARCPRIRPRPADELPVPLAQENFLDRHERMARHGPELGKSHSDPITGPDRDDRNRDIGNTAEELSMLTSPPRGAVDSGQDGRAGDVAPVQQFAGRLEGRDLVDTVLATEIQGQLGGFARVLAKPDRIYLAREKPCLPDCDESWAGQPRHLLEHCLDAGPGVDSDRGRGQRQVLCEGYRVAGTCLLLPPGSLGAPQQDAGRHLLAAIKVHEGFAEWLTAHTMPFVEVAGQDDAVLVHALSSPPHQVWAEAIIRGRGGSGGCRLRVRASSDCHKITSAATRRTVPACGDRSVLLATGGR